MYDSATTVVTDAITALGAKALVVLGATIVVAGGVFLIRWGFSSAKGALDGNVGKYDPILAIRSHHFKDEMEFDAYVHGRNKFRKEGFTFDAELD